VAHEVDGLRVEAELAVQLPHVERAEVAPLPGRGVGDVHGLAVGEELGWMEERKERERRENLRRKKEKRREEREEQRENNTLTRAPLLEEAHQRRAERLPVGCGHLAHGAFD
jgi:hypothetical protein